MSRGRISVGHPVDVASGVVYLTHEDIQIPGRIPLTWERYYSTALRERSDSPLGPGWTNRYFATLKRDGNRYEFVSPEGDVDVFADEDGSVEQGGVIRNLGSFHELTKAGNRYIVTSWDVDTREVERFVFNEGVDGQPWRLASIEDLTGHGLDLTWDKTDRLFEVRQNLERRAIRVNYNSTGRINSVSFFDPDGNEQLLARYDYDTTGHLVAAGDALGQFDRYEYDGDSRITRETVKDGGVFYFKYDERGRCVKTSGLDRYDEKTFCYFDHIGWTEVTDSLGHMTRYQWLPSGQVVRVVSPIGGTTQIEFDDHGRIVETIDPNDASWQFEYDEAGNRCGIIDPLGGAYEFNFDERHLLTTVVDPAGSTWTRAYDNRNQLIESVDALGGQWLFHYDNRGNLTQVISPAGTRRHFSFTSNGILHEATDWKGMRTRFQFDSFGRITERTEEGGDVTEFQYDRLGNILRTLTGSGAANSYVYDQNGNCISHTDENGHVTRFRYGTCGRLLEKTDPRGNTIRYKWSSEPGRLDSIVNGKGETHHFYYDEAGRRVKEIGFDNQERRFEFDSAGFLLATVNALGERTLYRRDPLGRLLEKNLGDGSTAKFEYDAVGNLVAAKNSDCDVTYEFDALSRPIVERQDEFVIENKYDPLGNVAETRTSLGHQVNYGYDANGSVNRIESPGTYGVELIANPQRNEVNRRFSNGFDVREEFSPLGQILEQRLVRASDDDGSNLYTTGNVPVFSRRYAYDKAGCVTSIVDDRFGESSYEYNSAEQLVSVTASDGDFEQYTYDEEGNLAQSHSASRDRQSFEYSPGNRLKQRGNDSYEFDGAGRLIRKVEQSANGVRTWRFGWNGEGRLQTVTTPDDVVWTYVYDALGRRVSKNGPSQEVRYVWNGDVVVHELRNGTVNSTCVFDPDSYAPVCMRQNGAWYAIITDQLGTPRDLVDEHGNVVHSPDSTAWGTRKDDESRHGVSCPLRFPGQWFDEESGLHYNRFRYYEPESARYISTDPIGLLGSLNLYKYVHNPTMWMDPLGLEDVDPNTINFSQTTVSPNDYDVQMRNNKWDWKKSGPIRVMEVDGQLVSYDNRRLRAAQSSKQPTIPIERVNPDEIITETVKGKKRQVPGAKKTWGQAFKQRLKRNKLPPEGTPDKPKVEC